MKSSILGCGLVLLVLFTVCESKGSHHNHHHHHCYKKPENGEYTVIRCSPDQRCCGSLADRYCGNDCYGDDSGEHEGMFGDEDHHRHHMKKMIVIISVSAVALLVAIVVVVVCVVKRRRRSTVIQKKAEGFENPGYGLPTDQKPPAYTLGPYPEVLDPSTITMEETKVKL